MAEFFTCELFPTIKDPSYQPTRLFSLNKNISIICSNNIVNIINIASNTANTQTTNISNNNSDNNNDNKNYKRNNDLFTVSNLQSYELSHSNTIQSICHLNNNNNNNNNNEKNLLTTIDSNGQINILQLKQNNNLFDSTSYELNLISNFHTSNSLYEIGWVGLTQTSDNIASCHYLSRELIWSDIETQRVQKKVLLQGNPTCISTSFDSPSLIFTGDNNGRFNVWDIRQGENNCCCSHSNLLNRSCDALYSILQM